MKIKVEIEVPDDMEPNTIACADECPLSYYDGHYDSLMCVFNNKCPVKEAMNEVINKNTGDGKPAGNYGEYSLQDVPRYN